MRFHHTVYSKDSSFSTLKNRSLVGNLARVVHGCARNDLQLYHDNYTSKTVQASAKVTIEREDKVIRGLSNGVIFNDLE